MPPVTAGSLLPGTEVDVEGVVSPEAREKGVDVPHYQGRIVDTVVGVQGELVIVQADDGRVQFVPKVDLVAALEAAPEEADVSQLSPEEQAAVQRVRDEQAAGAVRQDSQPDNAPPTGTGTDVPPAPGDQSVRSDS